MSLAKHDSVRQVRAVGHESGLDLLWGDVFTTRSFEKVPLAISNAQVVLFIEFTNITGVKPAIGERFGGLLGQVVVTTSDDWPRN